MKTTEGPLATLTATVEIYGRRYHGCPVIELGAASALVGVRRRVRGMTYKRVALGVRGEFPRAHVQALYHGSGVAVRFPLLQPGVAVMESPKLGLRSYELQPRVRDSFPDQLSAFLRSHQSACNAYPATTTTLRPGTAPSASQSAYG